MPKYNYPQPSDSTMKVLGSIINPNLNELDVDRENFAKMFPDTSMRTSVEWKLEDDLKQELLKTASSSETAPNEYATQLQFATILQSAGYPLETALRMAKSGAVQQKLDLQYKENGAFEAMGNTFLSNWYGTRVGKNFSKYMITGDDRYLKLAEDYEAKSLQHKTAKTGYGWLGDLAVGGASTLGSSSTAEFGGIAITGASTLIGFLVGGPAGAGAGYTLGQYLSKGWTLYESGMEQAGSDFYQIYKMTDDNGKRVDLSTDEMKGLFLVDSLLQGTIEVVGLEWAPAYKQMLELMAPAAIRQSVTKTFGQILRKYGADVVKGILGEAMEEFAQEWAGATIENAVLLSSNTKDGTDFAYNNWRDVMSSASQAFGEAAKGMILQSVVTNALGIGLNTVRTAAAAKNQTFSFDPNVKQGVINTKYIVGGEKIRTEAQQEEQQAKEQQAEKPKATETTKEKVAPIKVVQTEKGAVPATEADKENLKELYKRNGGKEKFDIIIEGVENDTLKAEEKASLLNTMGAFLNNYKDNGDVLGYADGSLVVKDENAVEQVRSRLAEEGLQRTAEGNSMVLVRNGQSTRIDIITKAQADADSVQYKPISNWQFQNMVEKNATRLSSQDFVRQAEQQYALKTLIQKTTGMTAEEVEDAFNNDVDSISMNLPNGVTWENLTSSAMFMPIMSQITGRNTDELLSNNLIQFDVTGRTQYVDRETNRNMTLNEETGKVELKDRDGNVIAEYDPNDSKHVEIAKADMTAKGKDGSRQYTIHVHKDAGAEDIMHELMHVTRSLASKEKLSGFIKAYGGEDLWTDDIKDNGDGTWTFNGQTYGTRAEAYNKARVNEEKFVRDFMTYLHEGTAPNSEVKTFFQSLKEFMQKFIDRFRGNLSEDTVRAFEKLLNGEVDPDLGDTMEEAIENSELTLEDDYPQTATSYVDDEDMYDEEGNPLYSLASDRQWQVMDANTQRRIDADYEATRNKYFGTDQWMKAPNGQPTNLTERQWVQVRTPAFKAWFGDWENDPENASKAVDENGEPKVYLHGSVEDFDVFDVNRIRANESDAPVNGFWFTDRDFTASPAWNTRQHLKEVFLNVRNPASYTSRKLMSFDRELMDELFNEETDKWNPKSRSTQDEMRYRLQEEGFDGVVFASRPNLASQEGQNLVKWTTARGRKMSLHLKDDGYYYLYYGWDEDSDAFITGGWKTATEYANSLEENTLIVFNPNQIKSATDNVGTFSNDNDSILYSLTPEQESKAMQELDSFPEAERNRIASNFERLKGTPWHREAMKALVLRSDMRSIMEGRGTPADSIFRDPKYFNKKGKSKFRFQEAALKKGMEGVFDYLTRCSFIAQPKKCVYAINSSLLNCNPSMSCAMFCYASEGNYRYWEGILKSEMITMTIEANPVRAAEAIASQYKSTTDYMVGKTLRIFDKGDFSEQYVTLVNELNKRDIAVQVFSKRPNYLSQINNGINVAMLSIDSSNRHLAEQNPDLAIATVYSGKNDVEFIEQNKERYDEHGGVILPIKLGDKLLPKEEIKALPQWARTRYTCPIDAGTKKLGEWNCQKCDINGTGGCFYKNTAENRRAKIYASLQDMNVEAIDEATRQIAEILVQLNIDPDSGEFRRVVENLYLHKSEKLAGIDAETERTSLYGDGEYSESGDSNGILHSLTVEENNRIVDDFASQFPDADIVELDGVKYIKHSNDTYTDNELRSIKDSVSETLHSIKGGQFEFDFSGQLELDFNGDQGDGQTASLDQSGNAGGTARTARADLRGLRQGVAQYFSWAKGWNGQEPSTAINGQWDNLGYISFVNTEIRSPEDVAKLYSVYRNPKLEYFHLIYLKGDTIVGHMAMSTGIPNSSYAVPAGAERYINACMAKIGADGYYMMHNHPSGDISPSLADKGITRRYVRGVAGFKGHIILDHNKFGFFDQNLMFSERQIEGMHGASEKKLTASSGETFNYGPDSFVSNYAKSFEKPTFSVMYTDYRYRVVDIEDFDTIPTRNHINQRMKKGFHSFAIGVTSSPEMYEEMKNAINQAYRYNFPKYNFSDVVYVNPQTNNFWTIRRDIWRDALNENVWGYVKGSKNRTGEAFTPKFFRSDDTDTLYSLSPERQAEVLEQRKNQIKQALEFGAFIRTDYLEEFRGEGWADDELAIRDYVKDNPEVLEMARNAKSVADFRKRFLAKEQKAEIDDDDIPFDEPEGFEDEYEDTAEDEQALKEDKDKGEHWYDRIYGLAHAQTAEARDRQFIAEWTASEDKTIELGKTLANYKDVFYASRPNRRSGGFHYVRNVWGAFSGVSTKVTRLQDGRGTRTSQKQRSSSEEIQEAQKLIRENPRAYRQALRIVEAASLRVGDFEQQRPIGESADWMEMDYLDEDIAAEMEKLEAEEAKTADKDRATMSNTGEYKKQYEELKKQMDDAIADLKKANEGLQSNVQELQDKIAKLDEQIKDYEKQMSDAEKEVDGIIGRMGKKIEKEEYKKMRADQRADFLLAYAKEKIRQLNMSETEKRNIEKQLDERRSRVAELRTQLTEANKEKKRIQNALDALRRWKEAKEATDYRKKRIKQIIRNATFNSNTLDAAFEEPLTWIMNLFARNEEDMAFRKDLQEQINNLKTEIEQKQYSGEDTKELKQRLIALQKMKKNDSQMLEPPAIVAQYLPDGYLVRRDNRQSAWTAEELDTVLDAVKLMRNDARVLWETRKARRKAMLMDVAYSYFRQATGYNANLNEFGQRGVGALKESVLGMTEKQFGKIKGAWLSYHLYKAKIQRIARLVDGDKEGVFYDWFVRKNYEHQTEELKGIDRRLALGDKAWKDLGLKNGELTKEGFRGKKNNGTEYSLTRGQMIGVYVYAQSDLGYEKLTSPEGNDFSEEDVATIISKLEPKELAWANFMLSEMQSNWIRLADTYYRVWNRNLGQRPAYFPLVGAEGRTIEQKDADLLCGQVDGKDGKSYVDKGFTKEVNPNALYPLNLDVTATWNKQVRRQEHFIAYGEWARDSQYLLDRGQLGETITRLFGPQFSREINRSVNHVISNYITTGTDFDRTITKYFSARNAAALAASMSTALKQVGSIGAITENEGDITKSFVGERFFRNFLKANAELNAEYGNVDNVRQFIYENAPDVKNRQIDFEVMAYLNRVYGGKVSNTIQRATGKMMKYTTNLMDKLVVERLWLARYYTEFENLREKGWTTAKAHKEASFKASQLISETQPTSMRMDQSGLQIEAQKSTLLRMVSVFTNQAMNLSNMMLLDMPMAFRQKNWRKVVGVVSSVLINVGIVALVSGRFIKKGDEDDEKYRWRLAREILGTVAQTVDPVFGGNLLEGLVYPFTGGSYMSEFTEIGGIFRTLMSPSKDKSGWDKLVKALEDLGEEALQVSGIPSKNLLKPLKAATEGNAGYLINTTWGEIIESYR